MSKEMTYVKRFFKEYYSFIVTLGDLMKDIVTSRIKSKGGYLVSFLEASGVSTWVNSP